MALTYPFITLTWSVIKKRLLRLLSEGAFFRFKRENALVTGLPALTTPSVLPTLLDTLSQ